MVIKQKMHIKDFEVWVNLGCSTEEQKFTQPVHISLELNFKKNIQGTETDLLSDAVDYVMLTQIMKTRATQKPFHLIEHLCYEILLKITDHLKKQSIEGDLRLDVKKIRVPVENLRNGVVFSCETTL